MEHQKTGSQYKTGWVTRKLITVGFGLMLCVSLLSPSSDMYPGGVVGESIILGDLLAATNNPRDSFQENGYQW